MAVNLEAFTTGMTKATGLANLILVFPGDKKGIQPQGKSTLAQPPKFLFDFETENQINLQADITDHFTEENDTLNDQIALRPDKITTSGFVSELNNVVPDILKIPKLAAEKLVSVPEYLPELSVTAQLVYNNAFQAYQAAASIAASAVSAYNNLRGEDSDPTQTKQQEAFLKFYGWFKERTLFTVQTPWVILENMAIESLRAMQDEDTNSITDFQITFKKINFARREFETGLYNYINMQDRAGAQGSPLVDRGLQSPTQSQGLLEQIA